ncbi:MAG TPA: PKD domain-containing protein [Bacteroidia bacterium]|nr:PKD domain-containing protein [Bacteroidia bacterium]
MINLYRQGLVLLMFLCCLSLAVSGQPGKRGQSLNAVRHDNVNMKDLERAEKNDPSLDNTLKVPNQYGTPGKREKNGIPRDRKIPDGAKIFKENSSMQRGGAQGPNQVLSPSPTTGFNALDDNISSIPPDVNGGVGPNHLMVTLNSQYAIQTRSGTNLSTVSIATFWSGLGISGPFDPKTTYDPYNNRWITVAVSNSRSANSSLLVAVSANSDPTGTWNRYVIDATGVDTMWLDYPSLGFNKDWIVVSGNMFGNTQSSYQTCLVYALNKADFYANGSGQYSVIDAGNDAFTLAPAITYDNSISTVYLAESYNGNSGGSGYIRLFELTGSVGAEVLSAGTYASTPNPWQWGTGTDFAPQLGSTSKIRCNDDRMLNCVYRNGAVWLAHSVFLPASSPTRASLQWWKLTTAGAVTSRDRIDDSSGNTFYAFPSISVNANDDALMGYSIFSSTIYPSAAYALKLSTDANFQSDYIFKSGLAKYYKTYSGSANRWGDYTLTQVDPVNDNDFWTLQEYSITPGSGYDRWGTWWANVTMSAPVADFIANNTNPCTNNDVIFTNTTAGAVSTFSWNFGAGASPATSSSAGPVTVQYSTTGLKTVTLSVTGPGGTDAITKTNYINVISGPAAAVGISGSITVCQGQNSVPYSTASIAGASSYIWTLPPGASIATGSGTNSITVNFSAVAASGQVSVRGNNGSCSGPEYSMSVTVNPLPAAIQQFNFSSGAGITINDNSIGTPFPSTISVSGLSGLVQDVNVIINGISHTYPDDIDILLKSPGGQYVTLMSDCGGGTDLTNLTLTVNDSAAINFPDASSITNGTYRPTNISSPDNYPSPGPGSLSAPTGSSSTALSVLNGQSANGDWSLFVMDDIGTDLGAINSWTIQILVEQQAENISGTANVCQGQSGVSYSIPVVIGASGYNWTLPGGAVIASGSNTNSITVDFSNVAVSGNISVTPFNSCGNFISSNLFSVTVDPLPVISSLNPGSGQEGASIQFIGSELSAVTAVYFNGLPAAHVVNNNSLITATVPAGATSGFVQVQNSCGSSQSPMSFTVLQANTDLNLKVFIQGFYTGSNTMRAVIDPSGFPGLCDTVTVRLAESFSPYTIAHTLKGTIGTNGEGVFTFPGVVQGNSYYVVVKHRNTMETWSAAPVMFNSSSVSYDFTNLASKSFGSNEVSLGDGNFAVWSGDVNQDGFINMADFTSLESSLLSYLLGYYSQDLNGDNLVEAADMSLIENNLPYSLIIQKP